jgi:hypothetical protein
MGERTQKLTERVPLNLTEEEYLDLSRMAADEDRSIPEFLRVRVIRPFMYGTVRRPDAEGNEVTSGFGALGGPER